MKVCNSFYLDPEKILKYNGSDYNMEAYEYLYEAASGNYKFNDTDSVYQDDARYYLSASSRVYEEFVMDVDQFLLTCSYSGHRLKCSYLFSYVQEPLAACYETIVRPTGIGAYHTFNMFFFFNSSKFLGKYTKSLGAHVIVSDPDDFISFKQGTFIEPNDFSTLGVSVFKKRQTRSFEKSKCVHKQGLETYNFTGEPFDVIYTPNSCKDLCFGHLMYDLCNCAPGPGWNVTKNECLEKRENRKCVNNFDKTYLYYDRLTACKSECLSRCEQTNLEVTVLRENWKVNSQVVATFLEELVRNPETYNPLAHQLLNEIAFSGNDGRVVDSISQNIAQCSIYLMANKPVTNIEIMEMVTFSTFLCNMGGLLGMWLGMSVISAMEMMQNCFQKLYLGSQLFRRKPTKPGETTDTEKIKSDRPDENFWLDDD